MSSAARDTALPCQPVELQAVAIPRGPVANDNANEWDGDLPYAFDLYTQAVVAWSKSRGGMEPVEVARVVGLSRQRIAEIEAIAIRKLRKRHGKWLVEFLEGRTR